MLGPEAQREGLGLHQHPAVGGEPAKKLASRVADCQHHPVGLERAAVGQPYPGDQAVARQHVFHPGPQANLDPQLDERQPHALHGEGEQVRPDVGLSLDEDAIGRPEAREGLDDLPHEGVVDAGGQLPVGVGPSAAFTEVHVALGGERPVAHELGHVLAALDDVGAPLQQYRRNPSLGQLECAEQPRRPHAHDDRPVLGRFADWRPRGWRWLDLTDVDRQLRGAMLELDFERMHVAGAVALPRVEHRPNDAHRLNHLFGYAQPLRRLRVEHELRLVEPESYIVDPKGRHAPPIPAFHEAEKTTL